MIQTVAKAERMIPVACPYVADTEEQGVLDVLRSGWLTQGTKTREFEERFAAYVSASHAICVSSCTTGLHLALWALGVREGDEVICPSLSFIATANAIAHTGATPVFVDVDIDTYNMDPNELMLAITPRTKAILVVHQVGLPSELDEIKAIADHHRLPLIEDAACAIGSEYSGKLIGAPVGKIACFSFHPRKVMTTGEGGMLTTNDAELAGRLRRLRQHAMSVSDLSRHSATRISTETYDEVGFNYRMTDLQAAVGIAQLARLNDMLQQRRLLAARYDAMLKDCSWLQIPVVPAHCRHNYQSYMVRLLGDAADHREHIMQLLLESNVSTRRGVMAIHRERPFAHLASDATLPSTSLLADSALILPLFHQMKVEEQDFVVDRLGWAVASCQSH